MKATQSVAECEAAKRSQHSVDNVRHDAKQDHEAEATSTPVKERHDEHDEEVGCSPSRQARNLH